MPRDPFAAEDDAAAVANARRHGIDDDAAREGGPRPNGHDATALFDASGLTVSAWLQKDIPPPNFVLGELLSTTSRSMLVAPTGLGKTNFTIALGFAIADAAPFLHWRASEGPRRVLFVDGEMSRRLVKRRLEDATRRHGGIPDTFHMLSRSEHDIPPLNTEAGQRFIDSVLAGIGGADFIVFDNVQALLSGDMKEEDGWHDTLPWIRDLTNREVGQLWVHHTGHDETHGYGTKTREWQLDLVALMERIERPEADIAFRLSFTKARERSPENRADFEPVVITLADSTWTSEIGASTNGKRQAKDRVLELLIDAVSRYGEIPPASASIPPDTLCVDEDLWRRCCERGCISEGSPDAAAKAFRRAAKALLATGTIGKCDRWVWVV